MTAFQSYFIFCNKILFFHFFLTTTKSEVFSTEKDKAAPIDILGAEPQLLIISLSH